MLLEQVTIFSCSIIYFDIQKMQAVYFIPLLVF